MKRSVFIKKTIAGGFGACMMNLMPVSLLASTGGTRLTILHTNDTHSRIDPFPDHAPEYAGMGGVAQRATLIKQIRRENPDSLLLDAGDVFGGTPYFTQFQGALDFQVMSKMGYDAMTIGDGEFVNGVQGFTDVARHAKFPFVSSNYNFGSTDMGYLVQELITRQVGGVKIGIFGLGVDFKNLVAEHHHRGVRYLNPITISQRMVSILRLSHRCDMIICLSHLGYNYADNKISDRIVAREVNGIDLIIGGHTHTFMDQPEIVAKRDGSQTVITQAGFGGIILGRLDFQFDEHKKVTGAIAMNHQIRNKG